MKQPLKSFIINDSTLLRNFLAVRGIKFSKNDDEPKFLVIHDIADQQLFDLGRKFERVWRTSGKY